MSVVDRSRVTSSRDLVDALPDAVVVIDAGGVVVDGNRTAERLLGRPLGEWVGASGLDLVHPDDVHLAVLSLASVQSKEVGTPIELRVSTTEGWRLMELVGAPAGDLIVLSMRDLTQRRRWEVAGDDVARFRSLVQHAATLTMLLDGDGTVRSSSSAITRLLGQDPEDICDASILTLVHTDDRGDVEAAIGHAATRAAGTEPVTVEARLAHFGGPFVPFELTIVGLLDDPTVRGLVVSGHDITRLRQAQEALAVLAHVDSLTGLPNRRAFDAALTREWTRANVDGTDSYVVVIDLDGFKALNDRFGHAAGDQALQQVAAALRGCVRDGDVVGRLGGDEFGVILTGAGGTTSASVFETLLGKRLTERIDALPAPVGFTVGVTALRASSTPEAALHAADVAMLARKP